MVSLDMCTKAISVNVRALSEKLNVPITSPKGSKTYKGANDVLPTDLTPVITHARPREIQFMRWGLIPSSAMDIKSVQPMFNARAETLNEKVSFKSLIMTSRCLILDAGFYERETQGNEKVEWKITPSEDEFFYKAGLWTTWQDRVSGEITESFTMITCDPFNHPFAKIHDRMPIIMNQAERRLWMNPNATKEQLLGLLKPCSEDFYKVTENSRKPVSGKGRQSPPLFN